MKPLNVKTEALIAYTLGYGVQSSPYPLGSNDHREFQFELHRLQVAELKELNSELKGASCQ
jgi:hypothetical protein